MVILGCQVRQDGPSVLLRDRLDEALDYLEDHPDMTVVVSGGQGDDEHVSEAQAMYDYLVEHGADGDQIIREDQSRNTWQNVNNTWTSFRAGRVDGTGAGAAGVQRLPPDPHSDAVEPGQRRRRHPLHPGRAGEPLSLPGADVLPGALCPGKVLFV